MNYLKLVILVLVIILAVSFAKNNTQPITISYYFGLETPPFDMYLLIFIPFFVGIVVGTLVGFGSRLNLKNTVRKLHKSKGELEEKLKMAQEAQISGEYEAPALEEGTTDTEVISTT
ncbi:MAG: LapA family protein [Syntrophobacterales bacterium]|nr:MAG: LapA family protein [Syntrophobacterales bacterium]